MQGNGYPALTSYLDTLRSKVPKILGSPKPLNLDSLRFLNQRWDSPQATSGMPYPSCISASSFLVEAKASKYCLPSP
jgi:hypothetical protein